LHQMLEPKKLERVRALLPGSKEAGTPWHTKVVEEVAIYSAPASLEIAGEYPRVIVVLTVSPQSLILSG
jgi:hypothetical protein